MLGVVSLRRAEDAKPPMPVEEIERMIDERKAAKQRRDFAEADGFARRWPIEASCSRTVQPGRSWKKK